MTELKSCGRASFSCFVVLLSGFVEWFSVRERDGLTGMPLGQVSTVGHARQYSAVWSEEARSEGSLSMGALGEPRGLSFIRIRFRR